MQIQKYVSRLAKTTPAQRQDWIQQWRASGLSAQLFAQQHGLRMGTFYRWLAQANRSVSAPTKSVLFKELAPPPVPAGAPDACWAMEILTPAGLLLRLR